MKRRLFNIVVCAFALVGLLAAGPTLAHAAEAPWEQSGEIEWQLDNGTLTIRPANGASSGELYDVPWENRKSEITSIVVEDVIFCSFNSWCTGCDNLETADVRGMRSEYQHPNPFDFRDCLKLKKIITGEGFIGYKPGDPNSMDHSGFPDGYWKNTGNGELYPSLQIPSGMAATWEFFSTETTLNMWFNSGTAKWGVFDDCLKIKTQNGYDKGEFDEFWNENAEPWNKYKSSISSISVEDSTRMTEVWDGWFSDYPNLVSADIRGAISNPNFSSCPKLKTITTGKGFEGYNCTSSDMYSSSHFPQGFWKNAKNGELYNYQEIPTGVEATWEYYSEEPSTDIWMNAGTAKWGCFNGNLTVKPQDGKEVGDLTLSRYFFNNGAWGNITEKIKTAKFSERVITYGGGLFSNCTRLVDVDLSGLDLSRSTSVDYMFDGCKSLMSVDLSPLDTSNIAEASRMFQGCIRLVSVDFGNCDFSNLKNAAGMFQGCESLKSIKHGTLKLPKLLDCSNMFNDCDGLTSVDLHGIDAPNITDMAGMFNGCSSLQSINLFGFTTKHVVDMHYLFESCSSLESLDLSSFDTREVVDMERMLPTLGKLKKLTVGENFSFKGYASSSNQAVLEEGSRWESSADGKVYDYDSLPSCVAATYTRVDDPDNPGTPDIWFTDVNKNTDHYKDIIWLAENGISAGYPDGSFRPMSTVVRQDMAAFLYRLAGSPEYTPTVQDKKRFSDVTVNTPHAKEIWWLASESISSGYNDGTFRPMTPVYRQDMSAFLHRLCNQFGNGIEAPSKVSFPDVNSKTPHAEDIEWLASVGISMGYPDGTFRPMVPVYRQDMAAFLHRLYNVGMQVD